MVPIDPDSHHNLVLKKPLELTYTDADSTTSEIPPTSTVVITEVPHIAMRAVVCVEEVVFVGLRYDGPDADSLLQIVAEKRRDGRNDK